MRKLVLWLALVLLAALLIVEGAMAQPPGRRRGPGGGLERVLDDLKLSDKQKETAREAVRMCQDNVRRLTDLASAELMLKLKEVVSQEEFTRLQKATERARPRVGPGRGPGGLAESAIVERIMSFDKNKDGKITKDELPERMQNLIARGDTNKDGALDRDEVRKLAADLAREDSSRRGPGGRFRGPPGRALAGIGLTPGAVERAVGDLKLSAKKKETAETALKACKEKVRQLTELARADLLLRVSAELSDEEVKKFKAALDRQPGLIERPFGPPGRDGRPPFPRPRREP
jgi:hypothetical protein